MKRYDLGTREIISFIHCRRCVQERASGRLEIGFTSTGFQVWCRTHNIEVAHFIDLGELPQVVCELCVANKTCPQHPGKA
jgi:hypothetical protein